ncbi:MAG: tetratricopeptide repeat protein, partial [Chitinophagaceae bacterium]
MILRYTATLFLFCLCFKNLCAQQSNLDSLLKAESGYKKEDTIKLNLLNEIAFFQQYVDPEKGLEFAQRAIDLATKLKDESGLARANYVMGVDYLRMDNVSKTLEYLQRAAKMYEAQKKSNELARVYNSIGAAYLPHQEHHADALNYLDKAIAIYNSQDNKQLLPNSVMNKALLYKRMDSVGASLRYFNEAIGLFKKYAPENKQLEARIYGGLGDAYIEFSPESLKAVGFTGEKYDTAVFYVRKALDAFTALGSEDGRTANYRRLGSIYLGQKKYALALENSRMAKQIAERGGFLAMKADATMDIASIYAAMGRYDSAFVYHRQYSVLNDSLLNDETERLLIEKEMQYNFDKKEDSLHFQNELLSESNELSKLQLRQQWLYSIGGMIL